MWQVRKFTRSQNFTVAVRGADFSPPLILLTAVIPALVAAVHRDQQFLAVAI